MYVCMHVCMYACMYVCMDVCMDVCMYLCMYACMHVCMYLCMHACMDVCMYVCMDVCMYVCIQIPCTFRLSIIMYIQTTYSLSLSLNINIYLYIYEPGPRTPHLRPPQWYPPPLLIPPTLQNLVFACYLHIYIHRYTYILPFPPLQPRISVICSTWEPRPRQRTLSTCIFLSEPFFRTAYSVPRTWFTTYLLPMDYAELTYANLDICTVEKQ